MSSSLPVLRGWLGPQGRAQPPGPGVTAQGAARPPCPAAERGHLAPEQGLQFGGLVGVEVPALPRRPPVWPNNVWNSGLDERHLKLPVMNGPSR